MMWTERARGSNESGCEMKTGSGLRCWKGWVCRVGKGASAGFIPVFDAERMEVSEKGKTGAWESACVLNGGSFSNPVQRRIRSWKGDHFES